MKYTILALALVLGACGTATPEQKNMNRLAAAQSVYGVAASGAKAYVSLPTCTAPITPTNVCKDANTLATIQQLDRSAYSAVSAAYQAIKANPSAGNIGLLVDSATAAATAYSSEVTQTGAK